MRLYLDFGSILTAAVFALLALIVFAIAFRALWPSVASCVQKQVFEDGNVAVALLAGLFAVAVAIIVAAAVH